MKNYELPAEEIIQMVNEPAMAYSYGQVNSLPLSMVFSTSEWSKYLYISERTLLRYKQGDKSFDPLQSDRILILNRLIDFGISILGAQNFTKWIDIENVTLGGLKPKMLFGTSDGIDLIRDELGRLAYGVLA